MEGNKRLSIAFDEEIARLDVNEDGTVDKEEVDYDTLAIKVEGKLTTLKDAGVKLIHQHYFEEFDRLLLQLEFEDGTEKEAGGFYRTKDLSEQFTFQTPEEVEILINHPYRETITPEKNDIARV